MAAAQRANPLSWTGRFDATGRPTLEAFLLSQAFARALIGPMTGGRKWAAAHYLRQLAGAGAARGLQRRWRILAVAPKHGEGTARAVWQRCTPGVGEWSKGGIPTHTIEYPVAGQPRERWPWLELVFIDYRNDRHVDRLLEGNCSLVWLDQARDLTEDAFDQAHYAVARYWPSGLERRGPPLKRLIVTSRMPLADHWIPRRFSAGGKDYALFRQPGGRAKNAEDRHLRERPHYYRDAALGMGPDWIRTEIDAEYSTAATKAAEMRQLRDEVAGRIGRLAEANALRLEQIAVQSAALPAPAPRAENAA